jgi:hypothetical protein
MRLCELLKNKRNILWSSVRYEKHKRNYDRRHRACLLTKVKTNDKVWIKDQKKSRTVKTESNEPRSYIMQTDRCEIRRNRRHLVKITESVNRLFEHHFDCLNNILKPMRLCELLKNKRNILWSSVRYETFGHPVSREYWLQMIYYWLGTLLPTEFPKRPWQKVSSDLFELNRQMYLLVIDYFSKYIEIAKLFNTSSQSVINYLIQLRT